MRRREAVAALSAAFALMVVGLTWLFGPYGLVGPGAALALAVLFVIDLKE